jgi:aspartate dehydrogenase
MIPFRTGGAKIGIIGFGSVTADIIHSLVWRGSLDRLAGVLVRPDKLSASQAIAAERFQVTTQLDDLLADADLIIEAAGHQAAIQFAPEILQSGVDVMLASVGVLAQPDIAQRILSAADKNQVWIPSGAIAGIDGLLAARSCGLDDVTYTSTKPPRSWRGTAGEQLAAEGGAAQPVVIFEGTARQAASAFPQNANVGATIALASLGLDRTRVKLVSDPSAAGPIGLIEAEGAFGRFSFEILALASPSNPKSSSLTGHSISSAVLDGMCFNLRDAIHFP